MTSAMLFNEDVKKMAQFNNESEDHFYSEQREKHPKLIHLNREQKPSILNISRENLSVLQSNMEEGFNKHSLSCWQITNRHTVLNMCTIILAISCIFIEIFKLPRVLENSRNIEMLKRDLEILQRQFYEENFLSEFKDEEHQMYDESIDDASGDDSSLDEDDENYNDDDDDDNYESESRDNVNVKEIGSWMLPTTSPAANEDAGQVSVDIKKLRRHDHGETAIEPTSLAVTSSPINDSSTINETRKAAITDLPNARSKRDISKYKYFANEPTSNAPMTTIVRKRRQYHKVSDEAKKSSVTRPPSKRNLRTGRQIFAAHYGADSSLFMEEDEHTGNGRFRHGEGIFKAWRPSDWMSEYAMDRHFSLSNDGKLTVHETGLYLVYAQIHYLDEHDENGFHLLVNGRPILQCMVYSPGTGHKSRSCFSSQVTLLQNDDRIVLKDVGISRYTLFQKDKSFFGLVKIGDLKHPQMHTPQLMETDE